MRPSLVIENRVASSKLVRLWRCVSDRVQPSNTDIGGLLARWEWPLHNLALRDLEYHGLRSDASQQNLNPDWRIYLYYSLLIWPKRVFIFGHICMFWHILYSYNIYFFVPVMSGVYIWSYFVHESMHPLHTCMHMCGNPSIHPSVRTFMLAIIDVCVLWWQMEMAPLSHTGDDDDALAFPCHNRFEGTHQNHQNTHTNTNWR